MRAVTALALTFVAPFLASCSGDAKPATLYRNSPLDHGMRVHFATFDAQGESNPSYNFTNCEMAARILNANVTAMTERGGQTRDPLVGFWCERGAYAKRGAVPSSFPAEFPTDT